VGEKERQRGIVDGCGRETTTEGSLDEGRNGSETTRIQVSMTVRSKKKKEQGSFGGRRNEVLILEARSTGGKKRKA